MFKWDKRCAYWDNFLKNIKKFTVNRVPSLPAFKEQGFHYTNIPNISQNCIFHGYYQSYKYFEDKYSEIIQIIELKNPTATNKRKKSHEL